MRKSRGRAAAAALLLLCLQSVWAATFTASSPQELVAALQSAAAGGRSTVLLARDITLTPESVGQRIAIEGSDSVLELRSADGQMRSLDLGQTPGLLYMHNGTRLVVGSLNISNWADPQLAAPWPAADTPTFIQGLPLWPTVATDPAATVEFIGSNLTYLEDPACSPEALQRKPGYAELAPNSGLPHDVTINGTVVTMTDFAAPLPVYNLQSKQPLGSMMWVAKQNTTMYCTPAPTPDLGSPSTLQLPSGPNSTLIVNSPEVFMAALFIATSNSSEMIVLELSQDIVLTPAVVAAAAPSLPFHNYRGTVVWSGGGQMRLLDLAGVPELLMMHNDTTLALKSLNISNWANPYLLEADPGTPVNLPLWPTVTMQPGSTLAVTDAILNVPPVPLCAPAYVDARYAVLGQVARAAGLPDDVTVVNSTTGQFVDFAAPLGGVNTVVKNSTITCSLPPPGSGFNQTIARVSTAQEFLSALAVFAVGDSNASTLVVELNSNITLTPANTKSLALPLEIGSGEVVWRSGRGAMRSLDFGGTQDLMFFDSGTRLIVDGLNLSGMADPQLGAWPDGIESETVSQTAPLWPTITSMPNFTLTIANSVVTDPAVLFCDQAQLSGVSSSPAPGQQTATFQKWSAPYPVYNHSTRAIMGSMNAAATNTTLHCTLDSAPQNSTSCSEGDSQAGIPVWGYVLLAVLVALAMVGVVALAVLWRRRSKSRRRLQDPLAVIKVESSGGAGGADSHSSHSGGSGALPTGSTGHATGVRATEVPWRSRVGFIDGLQLGPLIGRGGYAKVYQGRWKGTNVAVKIVETRVGEDPSDLYNALVQLGCSDDGGGARLRDEPLLSLSLSHPNVLQSFKMCLVKVLTPSMNGGTAANGDPAAANRDGPASSRCDGSDAGSKVVPHLLQSGCSVQVMEPDAVLSPGLYEVWLVSELADKGALQASLFVRGDPPHRDMAAILLSLLDVGRGLEYLHSCNVVHGDLKPQNVLLKSTTADARGFVCKLADFGLSRILDATDSYISTGSYGTVTHAAPELLTTGRLTKASDVFSFGRLAYELVSGERLFKGMHPMQIVLQVTQNHWGPVLPDDLPLADLLRRCMAEDPHARPDIETIVQELNEYCRELVAGAAALQAGDSVPPPSDGA